MGFFRSEQMVHKRIRIPRSTAIQIMDELGKSDDAIEFIDLNKDNLESRKNFSEIIARCDDMEKKFVKFEKICAENHREMTQFDSYKKFAKSLLEDEQVRNRRGMSSYFDLVENEIIEDDKKIEELIDSYDKIKESLNYLVEKKAVYSKCSQLFTGQVGIVRTTSFNDESHRMMEEGFVSDLNYITGVAKAEDEIRMKRMIFRVSKGRAISHFFNFAEVESETGAVREKITNGIANANATNGSAKANAKLPSTGSTKKIFTIFFQSGIENVLLQKMLKICDLFNVNRYIIPRPEEMQYQLNTIQNDIFEKLKFLAEAQNSIYEFIKYRASDSSIGAGRYDLHRKYFKKERLIFSNLNRCVLSDYLVNGEVWIPADKYESIKQSMEKYAENDPNLLAVTFESLPEDNAQEQRNSVPPTYFKSNDLIYPFQEIVNTYGIPRYREANPALFAIVTFPFLFGVMFGDIGHGLLLFLFASYLLVKKEEITASKSAFFPLLKARYLLLFMGFFAFYSGWMYNDFLSFPLNVFGSCYEAKGVNAVKSQKDCVYPVGMDPKWYVASNELAFFNSLKMKLSVILGVIQMICGIILKGSNTLHFGNYLDFVFEFVPQMVFMTTFFGYMVFMIFVKWSIDWSLDTSKAPNIISLLMNIFLKKGSVDGKPLYMSADYQETVHFSVLMICLVCIPLILLPKPIIIHKRQKTHDTHHNDNHNEKHGESLADLFVHQSIETIEFVLGSISNTASYLRLWALSLAHAQLAKVFFEKALLGFVQQGNLLMVIVGFFLFANVTFAVLMCMDLMECFLHTLRLHWVEFQNKFFKADGVKFQPYSFKYIIEQ